MSTSNEIFLNQWIARIFQIQVKISLNKLFKTFKVYVIKSKLDMIIGFV